MAFNPDHKGDHADHRQHRRNGDGGVCGDGVEKEVDYGWHGTSEALASEMDGDWNKTDDKPASQSNEELVLKVRESFE